MELLSGKCRPIDPGVPPLTRKEINELLVQVPGWKLEEGHLYQRFLFRDFGECLKWVESSGEIALAEGHYPDLCISSSRYVDILLYTRVIGGLSRNDFILAAKMNRAAAYVSDRSGL